MAWAVVWDLLQCFSMASTSTTEDDNQLLRAFLQTADESEANRFLAHLLRRDALPLIREIIKATLRFCSNRAEGGTGDQDTDDLSSEIVLSLLKRLREMKAKSSDQDFGSFRSYVAVTTYNACYAYLRQRYPQRYRLKSRLRYALTRHPHFALWEDPHHQWVCGLVEWRDSSSPVAGDAPMRRSQPEPAAALFARLERAQATGLPELLAAIFGAWGRPVEFDELVDLVAELQEISDHPSPLAHSSQYRPASGESVSASQVSAATALEQQQYLEQLWAEICKLPLGQRTALLLNLRDRQGQETVTLFAQLSIATIAEIAAALVMSSEQFAELWPALPANDAFIAAHLNCRRQQVINLRLSARRRLAKRMQATVALPGARPGS